MTISKIDFQEVQEFAVENDYVTAHYDKGKDGNWHLADDVADFDDVVESDTTVLVKKIKGQLDMKETVTEDKQHLFKLHNNYNIPQVIPCF